MTDDTSALITTDPEILGGKPVIAGTRISVQLILEKLRDGWSIQDLLEDYPYLTHEQIIAAIAYAAIAYAASAMGSNEWCLIYHLSHRSRNA